MRSDRRALLSCGAAVIVQAAPVLGWAPPMRPLFPSLHRIEVRTGVALTFDDGPGRGLDDFVRALHAAGAGATFFVTGEQARQAPALVREIIAAGHEVGVHGDRHRCHLRLPPWQVTADLRRARSTIESITGHATELFRPPYGLFSLASWSEVGRQGWQPVLWSRWGRDWEARTTPDSIVATIGRPRAGDILLLHDADRYSALGSWRATLAALPRILERCAEDGHGVFGVGDLLRQADSPPRWMDMARRPAHTGPKGGVEPAVPRQSHGAASDCDDGFDARRWSGYPPSPIS